MRLAKFFRWRSESALAGSPWLLDMVRRERIGVGKRPFETLYGYGVRTVEYCIERQEMLKEHPFVETRSLSICRIYAFFQGIKVVLCQVAKRR